MTEELRKYIDEKLPKLEGWCLPAKATEMAELILSTKPLLIVELGVFGGRSLISQALALRELGGGRVIGIDPWQIESAIEGEIEANARWWLKDCPLQVIHEGCMKAIWDEHLEPYVIIIRARAEHVAHLFHGNIDILHFDQNHSEFSSMRDIQLYHPLVKPGGYIWFDDTDWATLAKAIAWLNERATSVRDVGTCRLFRKEPVLVLEQQARDLTKVLDEFLAQDIPETQIRFPGTVQARAAEANPGSMAEERATGNGHDADLESASVESNDAGDALGVPSRAKASTGRHRYNRSRRAPSPN